MPGKYTQTAFTIPIDLPPMARINSPNAAGILRVS